MTHPNGASKPWRYNAIWHHSIAKKFVTLGSLIQNVIYGNSINVGGLKNKFYITSYIK